MDDKEQLKAEERGADVRSFLIADVRGYTALTQENGDEAARTSGGPRSWCAAAGTAGQDVTVYAPKDAPKLAAARRVAATLVQLGYRARAKARGDDFGEYYSLVVRPATRAQVGIEGWIADYPSLPTSHVSAHLRHLSTSRRVQLQRSRLLRQADRPPNGPATAAERSAPGTAAQRWQRVDRAVVNAAPWLPLINERGIDLVSERVGNYQRSPQLGVLLDQLWVE